MNMWCFYFYHYDYSERDLETYKSPVPIQEETLCIMTVNYCNKQRITNKRAQKHQSE